MLDYNEKLERLYRLTIIKQDIQSFASGDTMFQLKQNFREEYSELLDALNNDSREIHIANDTLNNLDEMFHERNYEVPED